MTREKKKKKREIEIKERIKGRLQNEEENE